MRGGRLGSRGVVAAAAVLLALASATLSVAAEVPAGLAMHDSPRPLPEVAFADAAGRPLRLEDFRGRVVLLNLWATWCAPCRKEMSTLDRLQGELGGPGFAVVALSIDRKGLPAVQKFYEEIGLERLAVYVDASSRAARSLKALGIPTTLLIDREGREIGRLAGPAEWDSPEMVAFLRHVVERGAERDATSSEARR
jgi:thiol-disulfide isomerase/thioredoxin